MSKTFAEDVQAYIDGNYLELEALADRAEVEPGHLLELIAARCVPPHSYEVRGEYVFSSTFGDYTIPSQARRYYHPSLERWARKAAALARLHPLEEVARLIRADFEEEFALSLNGRTPPWPRGVEHAWDYLMDGTWGLCLEEISGENMLVKEYARATLAGLVRPDPGHSLSAEARAAAETAVRRYNRVAKAFAPHEVAESSRTREVEPAVEKYRLASSTAAADRTAVAETV